MTRTGYRYGWLPQYPDIRDLKFKRRLHDTALPPAVDLRPQDIPIFDQGQLGSCTGNGIAGAVGFLRKKRGLPVDIVSRLFIYYNERMIEGTVDQDSGAMIRDGIKSVAQLGVCPETEWPYDISTFTVKPSDACYADALKDVAVKYTAIDNTDINQIKDALASGFPVVMGFTVYSSFESEEVAKTGVVPMPAPAESVLGGHCVEIIGYTDADQRFLCRNSWGADWGMMGYMTMPFAYLANADLASDFWCIELVS